MPYPPALSKFGAPAIFIMNELTDVYFVSTYSQTWLWTMRQWRPLEFEELGDNEKN